MPSCDGAGAALGGREATPIAPANCGGVYFLDEGQAGLARASPPPRLESLELRPEVVPELGFTRRPFDPRLVRREFPALQEQVHGRPLIWLDNAATTQKPNAVIDRLSSFYRHEYSNIHRAAHAMAARATDAYEGAREKVRRFLHAAWRRWTTAARSSSRSTRSSSGRARASWR